MDDKLRNQKNNLIERLGILMENKDQLAPVSARIFSYIILTGKVGTTFEDLVSNLGASKSTISTHLSHLQELKKIKYFTKSGDRKKYFIINKDVVIQCIDETIEAWTNERGLHSEIKFYKENANTSITDNDIKFDLQIQDNFIKFLDEATKLISELRTKIIKGSNL